jgi:hypothetical protein
MKALDLLKALRDDYIHGELSSDINEATAELEALQARIAELEALQAPRSCDGCKWEFDEFRLSNGLDVCNYCTREHIDRYEPKGIK